MPLQKTLLLCLVAVLSPAFSVQAEESLLDQRRARELTTRERTLFGPKSAGVRYDTRMIRAAQIATQRAHAKTTWYCWRYVKDALLAADVIATRPRTAFAKQAGAELCRNFGFVKLKLRDPAQAPVGAVIVYGGADAGHVELRTANGFVSDFISASPYPRPLIGIYVKRS